MPSLPPSLPPLLILVLVIQGRQNPFDLMLAWSEPIAPRASSEDTFGRHRVVPFLHPLLPLFAPFLVLVFVLLCILQNGL